MDTSHPQPKKILYLVNDLSQTFGWSTHTYLLAEEAVRQGIEVHVAVERVVEHAPPGVVQHEILPAPADVLSNPLKIFILWFRLRRLICSLTPDIVHIIAEPYVQACALGMPRGVPVVLTIHGTYAYLPAGLRGFVRIFLGTLLFRRALRRVSTIVSVSEQTKRFFLERTKGFSPDRVRVIYNGVNTAASNGLHIPDQVPTGEYVNVLTVGAVKKRKGVHLAIPALAAWAKERKKKVRYHVVGTMDHVTPYVQEVIVLAKEYASEYFEVVFHGSVTEERKRELLGEARLYIHLEEVLPHTTDVEGFGIGIVEAAAYGVPALVLRGSATVEAVSPMCSGIILETLEPAEALHALDTLLLSQVCTPENAKEWSESFLPASQFRVLHDLYKKLIRHHNTSVVVSAAYGMGNLGDEAICTTVVHDVLKKAPGAYVTILVFHKQKFLEAHPEYANDHRINIVAYFFSRDRDYFSYDHLLGLMMGMRAIAGANLFVWGGGGLVRNRIDYLQHYLRPLQRACAERRSILMYPIGVDKITNHEVISLLTALPASLQWHVRDEDSKANLRNIFGDSSRSITVIPDPVFHFPIQRLVRAKASNDTLRIGLNLAYYKARHSDSEGLRSWVRALGEVILVYASQASRQVEVVFLPTDVEKDSICYTLLKQELNSSVSITEPLPKTPYEYVNELCAIDVLFTSRMHALILSSYVKDLPVLVFLYDEKVEYLARAVPAPGWYLSIDEFTATRPDLATVLNRECVRAWDEMFVGSLQIHTMLENKLLRERVYC